MTITEIATAAGILPVLVLAQAAAAPAVVVAAVILLVQIAVAIPQEDLIVAAAAGNRLRALMAVVPLVQEMIIPEVVMTIITAADRLQQFTGIGSRSRLSFLCGDASRCRHIFILMGVST